MLNQIARFLKKVKSRKGYTLIEAATVVAITGAMAIVAVPIASDKIEDSKIAIAGLTTKAISTAMVKFFGDTGYFPIASGTGSFKSGEIKKETDAAGARVKILRSGLDVDGAVENDNTLDPALATAVTVTRPGSGTATAESQGGLGLWDLATSIASTSVSASTSTSKANAGTDTSPTSLFNLNSHLVTDAPGYSANGSLNWFGPYMPSVDQDPWGRNYLAYVHALNTESLATLGASVAQLQVFVPQVTVSSVKHRIFAWVISAGPDEKLQTAPIDSILKGDDIGTIISIPPILLGQNDAKKDK